MKDYYIKKNYITNPVEKYDQSSKYWTKKRIYASNFFQYSVYKQMTNLIDYSKKSKLIDIGCGTGLKLKLLKDLKNNLDIYGIDTQESIDVCKKELNFGHFIVDNISQFDKALYEDYENKFDYIICSDVIEHLENPDNLLKMIKFLSHKNTKIIISTPERIRMRGIKNNKPLNSAHVREWSFEEIKQYLENSGFQIVNFDFMLPVKVALNKIFFDEIVRRLFKLNNIYYNQVITLKITNE